MSPTAAHSVVNSFGRVQKAKTKMLLLDELTLH